MCSVSIYIYLECVYIYWYTHAALKNWCFRFVVLEKTLASPLDCKEIKPVNHEGNKSWIFIRRTVAEGEAPVLWPLIRRADSLEKTLILGKSEGRRRRGWQRMRWLGGITHAMDMNLGNLQEMVTDFLPCGGDFLPWLLASKVSV